MSHDIIFFLVKHSIMSNILYIFFKILLLVPRILTLLNKNEDGFFFIDFIEQKNLIFAFSLVRLMLVDYCLILSFHYICIHCTDV